MHTTAVLLLIASGYQGCLVSLNTLRSLKPILRTLACWNTSGPSSSSIHPETAQNQLHLSLSLVQDHPKDPYHPEIPQDPHHPRSIPIMHTISFILNCRIILSILKIQKEKSGSSSSISHPGTSHHFLHHYYFYRSYGIIRVLFIIFYNQPQ